MAVTSISAGYLEPAILGAVLISPLTTGSCEVDFSLGEFSGIIILGIYTCNVSTELGNCQELFFVRECFVGLE